MQRSSCSGSFVKETRALTMRSAVTGHQKLTVTSWEPALELTLLQPHEKLPKHSVSAILQLFSTWSRFVGDKVWWWGCLMSWLQMKSRFSYATTANHFSVGFWSGRRWASCHSWQWPDERLVTRRGFRPSQSQACTVKRPWSLLAVSWLSNPLQPYES